MDWDVVKPQWMSSHKQMTYTMESITILIGDMGPGIEDMHITCVHTYVQWMMESEQDLYCIAGVAMMSLKRSMMKLEHIQCLCILAWVLRCSIDWWQMGYG